MTDVVHAIAPWLEESWQQLQEQHSRDSLAHAMLFSGGLGIGKHEFLLDLAAYLLCSKGESHACGSCHVCDLLRAGTCPDYVLLTPEEDSKVITIDAVRQVLQFVYKTPQIAQSKVVVIDPADALSINAANALLKGLEEPPAHTFFLLATTTPSRLPATIRSRCRQMRLSGPSDEQSRNFLSAHFEQDQLDSVFSLMGRSPYHAVKNADNFLALVAALDRVLDQVFMSGGSRSSIAESMMALEAWPLTSVLEAYVRRLNALAKASMVGSNGAADIDDQLARKLTSMAWIDLIDEAQEMLTKLRRGFSLNVKLSLETLLIALQETAKQSCST